MSNNLSYQENEAKTTLTFYQNPVSTTVIKTTENKNASEDGGIKKLFILYFTSI
jgi:hypothetical protein